jgi:Holliday junction resolvase-like predicted endonuclease
MKQANKKGKKNETGAFGEQIVVNYVKNQGFAVLEVNYLKKWGEIDIVARETQGNRQIMRFIEVKTVSYETKRDLGHAVTHETWRPEDNVHYKKIQRMNRAIESWLSENNCDLDWQIDIAAVRIVTREKFASVKYIPNIIL